MAETYTNPFAGLPDTNFPNNPFWSGVKSGEREAMMAPFRGMEQERQSMDLQKKKMEYGEFASPEAQAARLSQRTATISANKLKAEQDAMELARLPKEEQLKIVELRNKMNSAEAAQFRPFLDFMGQASARLESVPENGRELAWSRELDLLKQTHPGVQIPEQFSRYSPQIMDQAKRIRFASINTPAHEQALTLEKQKEKGAMDRQREQSRATLGAAAGHDRAAMDRLKYQNEQAAKQTPGQFKVQNMRILNDKNSTPEQLEVAEENLSAFVGEKMVKEYGADPVLQRLALSKPSPETEAEIDRRKRTLFLDAMVREGIKVKMIRPDGTPTTISKRDKAAALAKGYKEAP